MSDEYFVYGVYNSQDELSEAFRKVQASGFEDIIVARDTKAPVERLPVCIRNPYSLYMKSGGMAGFLIGGLAGAFNCPHIPYVFSYQVLTPIMAAVSAAVFGAYLGLLINGMIQSPDKAGRAAGSLFCNHPSRLIRAWRHGDWFRRQAFSYRKFG